MTVNDGCRRATHSRCSMTRPEGDHAHPPDRGRGADAGRHHHSNTAKEKPVEGEVLAVGAGARDETGRVMPLDVKAGDRVLFGKWSGTEVIIDGEERLIMKESDILGIIEGKTRASAKAA
jgi:chaperonin GroES